LAVSAVKLRALERRLDKPPWSNLSPLRRAHGARSVTCAAQPPGRRI
jgi:hypothetical protein